MATYDFAVIGGGSGGMAAAKEAARLGASTVLFDYVHPTVHGSKWGLGGTCVNVGCVPKKLMHFASLMGPTLRHDAAAFGWNVDGTKLETVDWPKLVATVQATVKKLNFGYRTGLRSAKVTYINAYAKFLDKNTIEYVDAKGTVASLKAENVLIAVGGRPLVPASVPGAQELAITSDDIFSLKKAPGKTLVVGAAYIALESAGFLTELGFDTTVAVRSKPLRTFDRQCAEKVYQIMKEMGTKFLDGTNVKSMTKTDDGRIEVHFDNDVKSDIFDTVLYATGRRPVTDALNLQAIGINALPNGKLNTIQEKTTTEGVYAVGDCIEGCPELTPVAIKAGELLARRLFGKSSVQMNYDLIPSVVFTPTEYGSCGVSEEDAIAKYGLENIEVYLQEFTTLEHSAAHREKVESTRENEYDLERSATCISKLICLKKENEKIVGFHFVGPNAAEVTQGFAVAMKLSVCKSDLDSTIGIHPSDAESFAGLSVTRASGEPFSFGGCGGGKCG